ncbi:nuclear transport factor 2 family protein [Agrobacterium sp. CNPSo 3708]|uniref:nuclear transport factor 2 family protein n=1 Tax=unclassified Agrobacterium TaxID=2632611 RepID=UPI0023634524|nr:nuclear transport factor 2 family protein [Agrobacterium sp. CNPSo 3708]MDD1496861.1 nuclear transport factor 2 family protein [Agrobacterium sp. CNPSo 3708]
MNSAVELPVQKQLEAYNARDIDEFMRWWADDCQYFAFPSTLLARNALEIRERHIERFKEPDLHGQLLSRIILEDMVIDHETVTRNFPEGRGEVDVVYIYEVALGKIAKAWFKIGKPRIL